MTKDGPDFPDRLLAAGRFDGYTVSATSRVFVTEYCIVPLVPNRKEYEGAPSCSFLLDFFLVLYPNY